MKQGLLAFQYEQEKGSTGMTGLSGLLTYVELMDAAGLRSSVERHVRLRERGQGWTDSQIIISLMLLNLAGGESVSDLDLLEKDRGLCRILREFETCGMRLSERRALEKRWRVERRRSVPSESAAFRYLEGFHDMDEESKREAHRAFIAAPNEALQGLGKVNADLVGFVQSRSPQTEATLDMDATLVETRKQEALPQLQGVQGLPASDHLLGRGRPDCAFRVSGRQRTCGPSAVTSVDRSTGASACRCGERDAAV